MQIPYKIKILFALALIVMPVISLVDPVVNLALTSIAAVIGVVILLEAVTTRGEERNDFRGKITHEALAILDRMAWSAQYFDILYPVWSSKAEGLKAELLGNEDYKPWKGFYDSIEARNEFFRSKESFAWQDLEKLNQACFDSFIKIHDEISWVNQFIARTDLDDLLSKARKHGMI